MFALNASGSTAGPSLKKAGLSFNLWDLALRIAQI